MNNYSIQQNRTIEKINILINDLNISDSRKQDMCRVVNNFDSINPEKIDRFRRLRLASDGRFILTEGSQNKELEPEIAIDYIDYVSRIQIQKEQKLSGFFDLVGESIKSQTQNEPKEIQQKMLEYFNYFKDNPNIAVKVLKNNEAIYLSHNSINFMMTDIHDQKKAISISETVIKLREEAAKDVSRDKKMKELSEQTAAELERYLGSGENSNVVILLDDLINRKSILKVGSDYIQFGMKNTFERWNIKTNFEPEPIDVTTIINTLESSFGKSYKQKQTIELDK